MTSRDAADPLTKLVIVAAFSAFPALAAVITSAIVAAVVAAVIAALIAAVIAAIALASTSIIVSTAIAPAATALTARPRIAVAIPVLGVVVIVTVLRTAEQAQDPVGYITVIRRIIVPLLVFLGKGFTSQAERAW